MCLKSTYRYTLCSHTIDPAPKFRQHQELRYPRLRYSHPCELISKLDPSVDIKCSRVEESEISIKGMCPTCLLNPKGGFKTEGLRAYEEKGRDREVLKAPHKTVLGHDGERVRVVVVPVREGQKLKKPETKKASGSRAEAKSESSKGSFARWKVAPAKTSDLKAEKFVKKTLSRSQGQEWKTEIPEAGYDVDADVNADVDVQAILAKLASHTYNGDYPDDLGLESDDDSKDEGDGYDHLR